MKRVFAIGVIIPVLIVGGIAVGMIGKTGFVLPPSATPDFDIILILAVGLALVGGRLKHWLLNTKLLGSSPRERQLNGKLLRDL